MLVEIFPVVGNLKTARGCFDFQCMGQTNITKLEMMAIGFAVSRDVYQLSVTATCANRSTNSRLDRSRFSKAIAREVGPS